MKKNLHENELAANSPPTNHAGITEIKIMLQLIV